MDSPTALALVYFPKDTTYAVVKIEAVQDFLESHIIDKVKVYKVKWEGQLFDARIEEVGTEDERDQLDAKVNDLANAKSKAQAIMNMEIKEGKRARKKKERYSPELEVPVVPPKKNRKVDDNIRKQLSESARNSKRSLMDVINNNTSAYGYSIVTSSEDECESDEEVHNLSKPALISKVNTLKEMLRQRQRKLEALQQGYSVLKQLPTFLPVMEGLAAAAQMALAQTSANPTSKPSTSSHADDTAAMEPMPVVEKSLPRPELPSLVSPRPRPLSPAQDSVERPTTFGSPAPESSTEEACTIVSPGTRLRTPSHTKDLHGADGVVLLMGEQLKKMNHAQPSKLLNDLMSALFTDDELLNFTVVDGKDGKPFLDETTMSAMKPIYDRTYMR